MKTVRPQDFAYMGPAERLAAYVGGARDPLTPRKVAQFSLRIPAIVLARLDTMAARTGYSRNEVAGLLLAAGFEAVLEHLEPEVSQEITAETKAAADALEQGVE